MKRYAIDLSDEKLLGTFNSIEDAQRAMDATPNDTVSVPATQEDMMWLIDQGTLKIRTVLKLYNDHADKKVKRFSSNKVAVRRLLDVLGKIDENPVNPNAPGAAPKQHVTVDGTEYRSVAAAFKALQLPLAKHIPFRIELKKKGAADFLHGGKTYRFSNIV